MTKKLFYHTLYSFLHLGIIRRTFLILVKNAKLISSILPNILVGCKFHTILHPIVCYKLISTILNPNLIRRMKIQTCQIKDLHSNFPPPYVLSQIPPELSFPILSYVEPYDVKQPKPLHDYYILLLHIS